MKVLIVDDDQRYAREIAGRLRCDSGIVEGRLTNSTSYDVAALVSEWVNDNKESVVFVNLSMRCAAKRRQRHPGVEILKYLRFSHSFSGKTNAARDVHCVLYSYMTAEQLLRRRADMAVLFSEGVTLARLPFDPANLDLEKLSSRKATMALDPYIRAELTLPDERHDWANWWGIKQLCDVHRAVVSDPDLPYPARVNLELKELRTQQAVYLYGLTPGEINVTGNLSKRIHKLRGEIGDRAPRIFHVDDMSEDGWSDIFTNVFYTARHTPIKVVGDGTTPYTDYYVNGRSVFRALKLPNSEAGDDTTYKERVEKLYGLVKAAVTTSDFEADLILLDLRLFAEPGAQFEVKKISGAQILSRLRQEYGGTPVIMTTASNKAWTFEQLVQAGADGFWMKEGLDDRKSPDLSVRNYHRLLRLVAAAAGEHYTFLKKIKHRIDELRDNDNHWWESVYWPPVRDIQSQTNADAGVIFKILDVTIQMLRTFLHQYVMEAGYQSTVAQNFWSCAIIRHAANILEEVHKFDELPLDFRSRGTIGGYQERRTNDFKVRRGDWFAYGLYGIRNNASHQERAKNINWETLKTFLADLICYLSYKPGFEVNKSLGELREEDEKYRSLFDRLTKV
jgi:CheY-like chemotaxis protein